MAKYIDAGKLKYEIERRNLSDHYMTTERYEEELYEIIDSLEEEQPEDIVVITKTFLDALSKTSYNNKPITDAQIIVRQLLLFFENPKEYNPDAILEQPVEGLEDEITRYLRNECSSDDEPSVSEIARHFAEWGAEHAEQLSDE